MCECLERHVEGRARVVHRTADQSLHGDVSAARVHQADVETFVERFFPRLDNFRKPPRHPKWRETNLATVLPGWKRFEGAEQWLRDRAGGEAERAQFDRFLTTRTAQPEALSSDQRDRLFQQFLQWSKPGERR